jgi:autotransporter-associated beta strand protein
MGPIHQRILAAVFFLTAATNLSAQTVFTWNKSVGGSWNAAANWTPTGIPGSVGSTDGATFGGVSLPSPLTVTLDGTFTLGSLQFTDGATGSVTLAPGIPSTSSLTLQASATGANTIAVSANSGDHVISAGLVLAGPADQSFRVDGTRTLVVSGVVSGATASNGFTKTGSGTLTLIGANTYSGSTVINQGTVSLLGCLASTSTLSFTGPGTFNVTAATAGSSQSLGTLNFLGGAGTVTSTYGVVGNASLTFASLAARAAGATGNFVVTNGTNGTTNKIVLTGRPTGFIDQGTFFGGSNYAYYDAGGFIRGINWGVDPGSITTSGGNGLPSTNFVQITGDVTAQAGATFKVVNIAGSRTFTTTAGTTIGGVLKTGNNEGYLTTLQPAFNADLVLRADGVNDRLIIKGAIAANGKNALTISGPGLVTLDNLATNSLTGGTFVTGNLQVQGDFNLGSTTAPNPITLNGGTLSLYDHPLTLSPNHPLIIGSAGGTLSGVGVGGLGTSVAVLQGSGPLTVKNGNFFEDVMVSYGTQPFSGPITVQSGRLTSGSNATNPFGTGDITIVAGTTASVFAGSGNTFSNRFFLAGNGGEGFGVIRVAAGANVTLNGPVVLTGNASLNNPDFNTGANAVTVNGTISGNFGLYLGVQTDGTTANGSAQGALFVLTGANTHAATTVGAVTLLVNGQTGTASGTGVGSVTVTTGGTLGGTGQALGPITLRGRLQGGDGSSAAGNPTLKTGPVTFANGSTLRVAVGGASQAAVVNSKVAAGAGVFNPTTGSDVMTIHLFNDGTLNLNGTTPYTITVATYGSTTATNTNYALTADNFSFSGSPSVSSTANALVVQFVPVPEPAVGLVGLAGAGFWYLRRLVSRRENAHPLG